MPFFQLFYRVIDMHIAILPGVHYGRKRRQKKKKNSHIFLKNSHIFLKITLNALFFSSCVVTMHALSHSNNDSKRTHYRLKNGHILLKKYTFEA